MPRARILLSHVTSNVVEPGQDWRPRGQNIDDHIHGRDMIMMAVLVDRLLSLRVKPFRVAGISHDEDGPGIDVVLAVDLAEEVGFLSAPVAERRIEENPERSHLGLGRFENKPKAFPIVIHAVDVHFRR